jgi:hypothetical protein
MNTLRSIVGLMTLVLLTQDTLAAQYHWKLMIEGAGVRSVGDDETEVKVGDWVCTIGAPKQDHREESRRLGCSVDGGLQAYAYASCEPKKGKTEGRYVSINLQQKRSSSILVMLTCS